MAEAMLTKPTDVEMKAAEDPALNLNLSLPNSESPEPSKSEDTTIRTQTSVIWDMMEVKF